jgi:hypothetical protein
LIRLLQSEQGFDERLNIEKAVAYMNELRLFYGIVFIPVQHINRAVSDIRRIIEMKDFLAPSASDLKSSGAVGERCTQLIAIFNPCDPQYGLTKHFGRDLTPYNPASPKYTNVDYRSVHLLLNRNGGVGQYGYEFKGKVSTFIEL